MWEKLGSAGFLGITAEEDYGGLAMGYQAHCIVMEEISRASGESRVHHYRFFVPVTDLSLNIGSIGLSYAAHSQLCINQLSLHGTPSQKAQYLPPLIAGTSIGALAMSEHSAGSDVVSMRSTATPVAGGYVLNGTKMWITNGPIADTLVIYAKTAPELGSKGISAFILDRETAKGFSCTKSLNKLGMRGSPTGELAFDDVFLP